MRGIFSLFTPICSLGLALSPAFAQVDLLEPDAILNDASATGEVVVGDRAPGVTATAWVRGIPVTLPELPGVTNSSSARGVSGDGTTVGIDSGLTGEIFRFSDLSDPTAGGVAVAAENFPDSPVPDAASGQPDFDGSVVVGDGARALGAEAAAFDPAGNITALGRAPALLSKSTANDVDHAGVTAVGFVSTLLALIGEAASFDVTSPGSFITYGVLPGGAYSVFFAVSGDGSTFVGSGSSSNALIEEALVYDDVLGLTALGDLAGGSLESRALSVTLNGDLIAGRCNTAAGQVGCYWRQAVGADSVFGGAAQCESVGSGFEVCDAEAEALAANLLPAGWRLSEIRFSADGGYVYGNAQDPATTPFGWGRVLAPPAATLSPDPLAFERAGSLYELSLFAADTTRHEYFFLLAHPTTEAESLGFSLTSDAAFAAVGADSRGTFSALSVDAQSGAQADLTAVSTGASAGALLRIRFGSAPATLTVSPVGGSPVHGAFGSAPPPSLSPVPAVSTQLLVVLVLVLLGLGGSAIRASVPDATAG